MAAALTPQNARVIRIAIDAARTDARLFIERGEFRSPFEHTEIPDSQRPLFRATWYRVYDSLIAGEER